MQKKLTLAVIGTGMIGCSFIVSIRKQQPELFSNIMGYSSGESANKALKLGYIHQIASINEIFSRADVILLAAPLLANNEIIKSSPLPRNDQLVMDVGSVKQSVIQVAQRSWKNNAANFVPCHPISGLEKTGPEAADELLFKNKRVIITPQPNTSQAKIDQAQKLWQDCGAEIHQTTAVDHDNFLGKVSHLPHILSFVLVAGQYQRDGDTCFQWSSGGFKDFTRIASSSPRMWRDVCLTNATQIANALEHYIDDLRKLKQLIDHSNADEIENLFSLAKTARDNFYQTKKS